jgi:cobalt/nickel transport system ATP-binding protein
LIGFIRTFANISYQRSEPSAGLEPQSRRQLINLFASLPQTMVISSHDLRLAEELCPRTIVLDEGQVIADGDTKLLLHDPTC